MVHPFFIRVLIAGFSAGFCLLFLLINKASLPYLTAIGDRPPVSLGTERKEQQDDERRKRDHAGRLLLPAGPQRATGLWSGGRGGLLGADSEGSGRGGEGGPGHGEVLQEPVVWDADEGGREVSDGAVEEGAE